jgi:hypothetical protein
MELEEGGFQFDNAHAHVTKSSLKWLDNCGVQYLKWPANSLDLNPIKSLWSEMKRCLGEYESPQVGCWNCGTGFKLFMLSWGQIVARNLLRACLVAWNQL